MPQTWNRYGYAANNPLMFVDSDGRDIELAANLSKKDQNRLVKALTKLYQKESGRKIIDRLERSNTKFTIGTGKLPEGDLGKVDPTDPANKVTVDKSGKVVKADISIVRITIDAEQRDNREALAEVLGKEKPPSEEKVVAHETVHAGHLEEDPVGMLNRPKEEEEEETKKATDQILSEPDSMKEKKAKEEVEKALKKKPSAP